MLPLVLWREGVAVIPWSRWRARALNSPGEKPRPEAGLDDVGKELRHDESDKMMRK